ncbi:DUF6538 domain-containing protein [Rhizobium sp. OAE497]|uniref:DUF6538 domain-containing protein n=1 Tax=Rhizobium sp. OAE497 TaxID=2663796 RepID=UPI0018F53B6A
MGGSKVYSGDKRYLTRKTSDGVWYVTVDVPRAARTAVGKKRIIRSLKTADLGEAQRQRWPMVAAMKQEIEDVIRGTGPMPTADLTAAAMSARKELIETPAAREQTMEAISAVTDDVERQHGHDVAQEFYKLATGQADAIDANVDSYLLGANIAERTAADLRTAIAELTAWTKGNRKPSIVQAFMSRTAAEFRDGYLLPVKKNVRTINKKISLLSSYWKWMAKNGVLDPDRPNPWTGKSLPKPKAWQKTGADNTDMRPFTDAEVSKLIHGDADQDMSELMQIAALSGLRLEEIGQLRVRDCAGELFDITRSKTKASVRKVPIHSALAAIVNRRTKDKPQESYIFPDFAASGWDDARTMAVSKQFGRYRKRLKVDDRPEGQRRSRIDFHSFRRWFARKCEEAGQHQTLVARVMGHKQGLEITFATYSQAQPLDLMRACVESVKLPPKPSAP